MTDEPTADSTAPLLSPIVEQAIRVAAKAHRNQSRKGSDLPYIAHPGAVAMILMRAGFDDENLLAAAWLHDVVEDTPVTLDELREQFSETVIELVDAMSEDKCDADGNKMPWAKRKAHHLDSIKPAGVDAKAVMLADKLHNLTSMLTDFEELGEELWTRFGASKADLLGYYGSMIATAADIPELEALRTNCEQLLSRLRA